MNLSVVDIDEKKLLIMGEEYIIGDDECNRSMNVTYICPPLESAKRQFRCMWCTLDVSSHPIGCPIGLVNRQRVEYKCVNILPSTSYQTYGVFCSFNCAKAFAISRRTDPMFEYSISYLAKMYVESTGAREEAVTIVPSPPIELLSCYGGTMTDDQYRSCIGRKTYTTNSIVKMFPLTISVTEDDMMNA